MSEKIQVYGDLGPDAKETQRLIYRQVYDLRDHLLLENTINMEQAHELFKIGHLPRRISDLIEFLKMKIQRDRWYNYADNYGKKRKLKEYYMLPEDIDEYLLSSMHLMMPWAEIYADRKARRQNNLISHAAKHAA